MKFWICVFVMWAAPAFAQQPVEKAPDAISWGTAFANPAIATVKAWKSENRGCELAKIAIAEGIEQAAVGALKLAIHSPRPCAGCAPNGMPSGHTAQSAIGISHNWGVGVSFVFTTGILRHEANRHTWPQIGVGAAIGIGSDWLGQRLVKCD